MKGGYFLLQDVQKELADPRPVTALAAGALRVSEGELRDVIIMREALDARKKGRLRWVYTLAVCLMDGRLPRGAKLFDLPSADFEEGRYEPQERPVIIGLGPAGIFCALTLVKKGYRPVILEQGKPVAERAADVRRLAETGELDGSSNVLFGEGGAGTFSDGKLTARNQSAHTHMFYKTMVEFGADPRICYQARPHLGSDSLRKIIPAITGYLAAQGVEIRYGFKVESLKRPASPGNRVVVGGPSGEIASDCVVLAVGHSADCLFYALRNEGVKMTAKPFAVGVRIEHPREFIDEWQYGKGHDIALTGAADYKLTASTGDDRGIYSFCVCPGGEIINASSHAGRLSVNGMSLSGRNSLSTNGAIVVAIQPSDLLDGPLAGLEFRRQLEETCHAGGPMMAPVQTATDFTAGRKGDGGKASYRPGVFSADINRLFPGFVAEAIRFGLNRFDRQIRGFIQNGVLVAPETGTSCPVRISRDPETMQALNYTGLYPIGEGAGYAGGIVSSAADGIRLGLRFKSK